MQFIIYASSADNNHQQLTSRITAQLPTLPMAHFNALENLVQHLRTPIHAPTVAILWPQNSKELTTFIKLRHLLRNMRIILILPSQDKGTISQGHMLRPRYVGQADGNLSDVLAVLDKMARMEKTYISEAV